MPNKEKKTYLGDGVYARFDGYQIWLLTPRDGGWHQIALEAQAFDELRRFAAKSWPAYFK